MAGMIKNIFGLDTQDVLKKRAERNRLLAEQRIKQGDIDPTVAILGQQFGDMLGRGLMERLGYEDPEMAKAKENEALQKTLVEDLAKLDTADPERLKILTEAYRLGGNIELATTYANLYRKIKDDKRKEIKSDWFKTSKVSPLTGEPIKTDKERLSMLKALHPNENFKELEEYVNMLKKLEVNNTNSVNSLPDGFILNTK